jgi:hypothetical protein
LSNGNGSFKGFKMSLMDADGCRVEYAYMPSVKNIVYLLALLTSVITYCVVTANTIKQIPINTNRITCVEKCVIKIRSSLAGSRVLNEEIIKKLYPPESAELIIRQANETSIALERELDTMMRTMGEQR